MIRRRLYSTLLYLLLPALLLWRSLRAPALSCCVTSCATCETSYRQ
ncbi:hypothetical protein Thi970DRAFT_03916 [Thiorhodovibrio frisius]|uniref:Uncharacterized protein n=1 Tax=Thiorhodovibrio frisius TaxID=631362 RepID=H8Z4N4_9GAMM|nr:hypothetical protein Thi970DRAFT_03916 [Thiorhodovibrio frisius]WPL21028.1 hypothetical protein Thiofri_01135 [Thiorhodovibrio frisius]